MPRLLNALWILAEEVEIEAEVEDAEVLFAVVRTEQIRTESRAASDHLPELDLRVDRLEEDQVHDLGNVDAGVEHVHRDGDVRRRCPSVRSGRGRLCGYVA